jgi:hypothetical protein
MQSLLEFFDGYDLPKDRIDGTYVGSREKLIESLILGSKNEWKVLILGEISIKNDIIKEYEGRKNKYKYYCTIKNKEKKELMEILKKSYLEVVYFFDENDKLKIIVEDFPEDISIDINIFRTVSIFL